MSSAFLVSRECSEQNRIHSTEHGGGGAYAQSERKDPHRGETRRFAQAADGVPQVLGTAPRPGDSHPTSRDVILHRLKASDSCARGAFRLCCGSWPADIF